VTAGQTRIDRWEAALVDYLARRPGQAMGAYVVVPLAQFCSWSPRTRTQEP
jgi:hypothetical protein